MNTPVPAAIKAEHAELNLALERAAKAGGMTGAAAKQVAQLFQDHLAREEQYALPPLTILKQLASGNADNSLGATLAPLDRLELEMQALLAEHFALVQALNRLADAADSEDAPEHLRIAERMISHIKMEEDVLYPAAVLVGRYLRTLTPATA